MKSEAKARLRHDIGTGWQFNGETRPPVVLFVGFFGTSIRQSQTGGAFGKNDPELFANEAFTSVWKDEFEKRVSAFMQDVPAAFPWKEPSKETLQASAVLRQGRAIREALVGLRTIPCIPVPFNFSLCSRISDSATEEALRQDRRQGLYAFMQACSPIACICALPAQAATEFLSILDPIPLPTFLTVATNRGVTQPECDDTSGLRPDRTHVVRLPPSNKLQAQAIRERTRSSLGTESNLAYIFRSRFEDLYAKDLADETERALQGSGIAVRKVESVDLINGGKKGTESKEVIVCIGYETTLDALLEKSKHKNKHWMIIQTDGCSIEQARKLKENHGFEGSIYIVRPTLDPKALARHAYSAIDISHSDVRSYPPEKLRERLAGFRHRVIERLERLDSQYRFLDGENVGAWYSVDEVST